VAYRMKKLTDFIGINTIGVIDMFGGNYKNQLSTNETDLK
jgi:hypothetical protein